MADEVFPFESLSDWASYANQLSVVTVVDERDGPPPGMGGEYTGCSVTLRIDETLWVAPEARTASGQVQTQVWCATPEESSRSELGRGGPPLRAGQRYLVALVAYEHGYWGPMTESSVLRVEGERVPVDFFTVHPVVSKLVGLRLDEIAALLAAAPADPIAQRFRHLDAVERVQKVFEIRYKSIESEQPWVLPDPATPRPEIAVPAIPALESDISFINGEEEFGPVGDADGSAVHVPSEIRALDASPYFWLPPAATMQELVAGAEAIVIGTVHEILREANEGPYGPDGELQSPRSMDAAGQGGHVTQHPGLDVTYFEVRIEEILLNDGRLVPGGSFELRLVGHASKPQSEAEAIRPLPDAGQRSLFVMGVNPDLLSYGTGLWGEIDISSDQPRYRDWDRTPVVFAEGWSPEAFLDNLRAAIEEREG